MKTTALWYLGVVGLLVGSRTGLAGIIDPADLGIRFQANFTSVPKVEYLVPDYYRGGGLRGVNAGVQTAVALNYGPVEVSFYTDGEPFFRHFLTAGGFPEKFAAMGRNLRSTATIRRFSRSARALDIDFSYEGPAFSLESADRTFNVRVAVEMTSCDRENILKTPSPNARLEEIIASFNEVDFVDVLYCDFAVKNVATAAVWKPIFFGLDQFRDKAKQMTVRLEPGTGRLVVISQMPTRSEVRGQNMLLTGPGRLTVYYTPVPHSPAEKARALAATQAAHRLVEILHDYGDLLILLASGPGDDPDMIRRTAAVQGFFSSEKVRQIREARRALNAGISDFGLSELLSAHLSIRQAYEYVRILDFKITGKQNFETVAGG